MNPPFAHAFQTCIQKFGCDFFQIDSCRYHNTKAKFCFDCVSHSSCHINRVQAFFSASFNEVQPHFHPVGKFKASIVCKTNCSHLPFSRHSLNSNLFQRLRVMHCLGVFLCRLSITAFVREFRQKQSIFVTSITRLSTFLWMFWAGDWLSFWQLLAWREPSGIMKNLNLKKPSSLNWLLTV